MLIDLAEMGTLIYQLRFKNFLQTSDFGYFGNHVRELNQLLKYSKY